MHRDVDILYQNTGKVIKNKNKIINYNIKAETNPFYGILKGTYVIMTLTALVRVDLIKKVFSDEVYSITKYLRGDLPLWLELANITKFHYIERALGFYRITANSASKQLNKINQINFQESSKKIRLEFAEKYEVPQESC